MKRILVLVLSLVMAVALSVSSPNDTDAATTIQKATVSASTLLIREYPSLKARSVGTLKRGNVTYIHMTKAGGWVEIRHNGKPAYVPVKYLKVVSSAPAKVYPVMYLDSEIKKLPIKLTNGLVIGTEPWDELGDVPIILKNGKKVWSVLEQYPINPNGAFQFSVTSNGDTFLFYYSGASGASAVNFVGVHANGQVFVRKNFGLGVGVYAKFLSADKLQVEEEQENVNWNPERGDSNAEQHSGIWDVKVYQISSSGKMTVEKQYLRNDN